MLQVVAAASGELEQAADRFGQALDFDDENAQARVGLGHTAVLQGDCAASEREYREAWKIAPRLAAPFLGQAVCRERDEDHRQAASEYATFLERARPAGLAPAVAFAEARSHQLELRRSRLRGDLSLAFAPLGLFVIPAATAYPYRASLEP